jgi:REP element-mobilizing transposase RayT
VAKSQIGDVRALSYNSEVHKHLRRLGRIWIEASIYFVTTCVKDRRQLLACDKVANILIAEWHAAHDRRGWAVGRYVIMPDHVHFFADLNWTRSPYPSL